MKENNYNSMSRFLIIVLNVLIVFGVVAFVSLVMSTLATTDISETNGKYLVNCILLFTGTSSLVFILYSLRKILKSVINEGPFNMGIVKCLKNIATSSFIITICYLVNFFYNNQFKNFSLISIDSKGIHTDTEFLIFFFAGCFVLILAQIYKQAVEVKEENDFTV
ncbi:DUF2975 domain-containing protein [Tepidanaerobacter sp. GT38]|uniref:DUF2975 domain-containing protein n=1 Tax=Tepidanaerobacter sp. GT38 TaxID=2722793 RepID=UPI001F314449|nr:DUF2975 domain-containing protein [Tepidanaerobacter sp. GT38]MCG1013323.1 DUF2975 domain-containing protein [Tepidanaerobacter sp. GT38]